jgi:bifunctional non-homologous end joining protein LigD
MQQQRSTSPKPVRAKPGDEPLQHYWAKRDFSKTPEPRGAKEAKGQALAFVVQKHDASHLHYDFRLELNGVMLSWAVPKGPSFDPKDKRMAVQVEDHPISYNSFEGTIPPKQYGAGTVIIWDRGNWDPVGDPRQGLADGKLAFELHGQKLAGLWELVRIKKPGDERQTPWLLFKKKDRHARARAEYDVVTALPDSVVSKPLKPAAAPAVGVKRVLPARLSPQLATLASGLPAGGDWRFEIKFDGYRVMTRIEHGKPKLVTRSGHDWTAKLPALARELAALGLQASWLDGEIAVLVNGTPRFGALQNAIDGAGADDIVYFLFDLPFFEGHDLRGVPLRERRQLLKTFLESQQTDRLRFSADFEADPASVLQSACSMNLEGLIAKRGDAPYESTRTTTWLKLKCRQRQEFVVAGFTDRGQRTDAPEIGSLLLGLHDAQHRLVTVGRVGTGWDAKTAAALKSRLLKLETTASPFAAGATPKRGRWTRRTDADVRWVQPSLVVEVGFADWTADGQIRHARFEAVRTDKPAKAVGREAVASPAETAAAKPASAVAAKVTHPERVIDKSTGLTKIDLVRYYESVADWMLPHLKGRPCSLVRGPNGVGGTLFFQKHADKLRIPGVKEHDAFLEVPTAQAIANAAQMNVIEFHTGNTGIRNIDKPDRVVFDIDPGEGVPWTQVQEAATLTRSLLHELGLVSWLKTSGGKGLHVVVPLSPRHDWATVKGFAQALVQHLARVVPARFVAKSGPANRVGKIFVDYLRNGQGATTVAAYSARARPGLGVSMPVPWDMLGSLKSGTHFTIATAREHLSFQAENPWADYGRSRQSLTKALKRLQTGLPA